MNEIENGILDNQIFALSCQTRRLIMVAVKSMPLSVRDIAQDVGVTQVTVKRHIKILLDCLLLTKIKKGNSLWYQTNNEEVLSIVKKLHSLLLSSA